MKKNNELESEMEHIVLSLLMSYESDLRVVWHYKERQPTQIVY